MNGKLNIQDLAMLLAEKQGVDKKMAEAFVKEFFLLIEEGLEKDKYVKVKGLGTFKLIEVESRESVDVNTGGRIEIKGHTKISFTPEPSLKEIINRPFSHFESVVLNDHVVFDDVSNEEDEDLPMDQEGKLEQSQVDGCEKVIVEAEPGIDPEPEGVEIVPELGQIMDIETEVVTEDVPMKDVQKRPMAYYFQWFLVAVMILCLGSILAMYWDDLGVFYSDTADLVVSEEHHTVDMGAEKDTLSPLNQDTLGVIQSDKILSKDELPLSEAMREVKTEAKDVSKSVVQEVRQSTVISKSKENKMIVAKPFTPDSTGYDIVGTEGSYTIKEGETLTRVALKFYGTKALWPYIVKHNPSVIVDPDNVPFGTTIKIPKLKKKQ